MCAFAAPVAADPPQVTRRERPDDPAGTPAPRLEVPVSKPVYAGGLDPGNPGRTRK